MACLYVHAAHTRCTILDHAPVYLIRVIMNRGTKAMASINILLNFRGLVPACMRGYRSNKIALCRQGQACLLVWTWTVCNLYNQ